MVWGITTFAPPQEPPAAHLNARAETFHSGLSCREILLGTRRAVVADGLSEWSRRTVAPIDAPSAPSPDDDLIPFTSR
jgi:putative SOS response-associated peptidase YedK